MIDADNLILIAVREIATGIIGAWREGLEADMLEVNFGKTCVKLAQHK